MSERPFSQALAPQGAAAVVAHRGASAREAENTLAAFELAIGAGADVVEFDVRITGDGQAVVMHDPDVGRTTGGTGLVRELRLERVRALDIVLRNGSRAQVPTLEEALAGCSGRVAVDIEIKNIPGEPDFDPQRESAVEATLAALDAVAFSGEVLISSFNPLSIALAKELAPEIATGLLTVDAVEAGVAFAYAREQGHGWILPSVASVLAAGPAFPGEVHAAGMRLGTWITDDPEVAVDLMRSGVDAVATNDPETIVVARRAAGLA
jgi:glycerophosphoryl diester phosphodiesterase